MASTKLQHLKLGEGELQKCPLCGMGHAKFIDGLIVEPDNKHFKVDKEYGYSFCNCRNIFYTNWSNIEQTEYNKDYANKYDGDIFSSMAQSITGVYFPLASEHNDNIGSFLEIGSINRHILDKAKERGWDTTGVDINPDSKVGVHKKIIGDIENKSVMDQLGKYDFIWMSHIFEHFKDPIKVAEELRGKLNDNGILFVSMPDTFFIDWRFPQAFPHWVIKEHHILWDMDSFIDLLVEMGYENIHWSRNAGVDFTNTTGDFHLLFKK